MTVARDTLVVAANRGPVQLVEGPGGTVERRRGSGGLVSALRPLVHSHEVTWVATATTPPERACAAAAAAATEAVEGGAARLRLVDPGATAYAAFYETAANPVLWFVLHGLARLLQPGRAAAFPGAWETGYRAVGDAIAAAVVEEARRVPGSPVLLQDYHLLLVPAAVRSALPAAPLSLFVHVPWPDPDGWHPIPDRIVREIHESLLACDAVGFHVPRWRDAFVAGCEAFLGRGAEAARVGHANPVAIDPPALLELADAAPVLEHLRRLERNRPRFRILRVDRTDPSKNAVRGLQAFERLLERRPDLRGEVELLALLDPSRQGIPEYRAYRDEVEAEARRIEERFGRPGRPAVTVDVRDDFPASVAAYLDYDVLLVNSVRDGLNLVALEAPTVNRRDGVVVLSTETGAADVLGGAALPIDPLDIEATASVLATALDLHDTDRRRHATALRTAATRRTVDDWIAAELVALDRGVGAAGRVPSS